MHGATEHCVTMESFWVTARRKVDGMHHAWDRDWYVSRVKGSFPLEGLPEGFGDNLGSISWPLQFRQYDEREPWTYSTLNPACTGPPADRSWTPVSYTHTLTILDEAIPHAPNPQSPSPSNLRIGISAFANPIHSISSRTAPKPQCPLNSHRYPKSPQTDVHSSPQTSPRTPPTSRRRDQTSVRIGQLDTSETANPVIATGDHAAQQQESGRRQTRGCERRGVFY